MKKPVMNRTGIEWTQFTWNPVTGCLRDCWYCYVKRIPRYDNKPKFHPDRLQAPILRKKPARILVCSTGDIFGSWVQNEWIAKTLETIRQCPQHTFQLLTKYPDQYSNIDFPANCILGITVTKGDVRLFETKNNNHRFVSLEPLLGPVTFRDTPDWIIVGAYSGKNSQDYKRFRPKKEWILDIVEYAKENNIPIFLKDSLKPVWHKKLYRELPFV